MVGRGLDPVVSDFQYFFGGGSTPPHYIVY